jgi:polyisoprenoid-binding protein YceI
MPRWTIDPDHSHVEFSVRHLAIATVRGRFRTFGGEVETDDAGTPVRVHATLDAASIDTGVAQRDAHLRSPDFLDAGAHPTLVFESTQLVPTGGQRAELAGTLTMREVTHPVALGLTWHGPLTGLAGEPRMTAEAHGVLQRSQWGLTWNRAIEAGGMAVSDDVKIALEIQVVAA